MAIWRGEGNGRIPVSVLLTLAVWFFLGSSGCLVKRTVKVPVSPAILAARTATPAELIALRRQAEMNLYALSSGSLRITYTGGKQESGKLQQYRSAPGYLLLREPDSIRMNIQNPVTKTTLADMVSSSEDFSVWYPRENKLFRGRNSDPEYELDDGSRFSLRPRHVYEALMPGAKASGMPGHQLGFEEDQDESRKYYVLSTFGPGADGILRPLRREWVDRSNFAPVKVVTFDPSGRPVGIVHYRAYREYGKVMLPLEVRIERPVDGYSLDLAFRDWRLNPELPEDAFLLKTPPDARLVQLQAKARSEAP